MDGPVRVVFINLSLLSLLTKIIFGNKVLAPIFKSEFVFQRSSILEALAKVQAPEELFNQIASISSFQTKGLKRHINEGKKAINSIAGSKSKRLKLMQDEDIKSRSKSDPNVVGFEVSFYTTLIYIQL